MYTEFMGRKAKSVKETDSVKERAQVVIYLRPEAQQKLKEFVDSFGGTQRAAVSRLLEWFVTIPPEQAFAILRNQATRKTGRTAYQRVAITCGPYRMRDYVRWFTANGS